MALTSTSYVWTRLNGFKSLASFSERRTEYPWQLAKLKTLARMEKY
jgi:hypothetical protein